MTNTHRTQTFYTTTFNLAFYLCLLFVVEGCTESQPLSTSPDAGMTSDSGPTHAGGDTGYSPFCQELPTLQTEAELRRDMELCPYVTSQYQALLFDLDSGLYQGDGCFEDVGCPDVQVACPFVVNGGEANCQPEDVAACADWFRQIRESRPENFTLEDIQYHLDCECRCQ